MPQQPALIDEDLAPLRDSLQTLTNRSGAQAMAIEDILARLSVLERGATPPPPPPPPPPVPTARQLVGGFRLKCEFARGGIALRDDARKLWLTGHAQRSEVLEFDLPAEIGAGSDPENWPVLEPVRTIAGWW